MSCGTTQVSRFVKPEYCTGDYNYEIQCLSLISRSLVIIKYINKMAVKIEESRRMHVLEYSLQQQLQLARRWPIANSNQINMDVTYCGGCCCHCPCMRRAHCIWVCFFSRCDKSPPNERTGKQETHRSTEDARPRRFPPLVRGPCV